MAVCLDADRNEIISHPFVKELLKNRKDKKIKIDKKAGCPVCNAIANEEMDDEAAGEARYQERHLWGMTPVAMLTAHDDDWRWLENLKPSVLFSGQTIHNELLDAFVDNGGDITDPAAAVLVNINRKGTKKFNTKYKAKTDNETARKPWKASKALKRALIDFMKPGQGEGDLFRIVANMVKGTDELVAALKGVKIDEEEDGDDSAPEETKPTCFGQDFEADDEDDCGKCDFRAQCAKACGEEVDDGDDDDGDEEDDLPGDLGQNGKGPKPKGRKVEDEDDDDDEDDGDEDDGDEDDDASTDDDSDDDSDDDDDGDEDDSDDDGDEDGDDEDDPEVIALQLKLAKAKAAAAKKGKSGKKGKAAKKPEPEDDSDDDDEPPAKPKGKSGKKGKAAKKPEPEDDDEDLDKLDAELQRLSKGKK